jgi:hypothetical protein
MVSPNQDPYEVPTPKHRRIIHTCMARIKVITLILELQKRYIDNEVFELKT